MGEIIRYVHHDVEVCVDEDLRGKHREHCLCYSCDFFNPGQVNNCRIAQRLYELVVEENLVTPVYECAAYQNVNSSSKS